jgi:adenylate cyclase
MGASLTSERVERRLAAVLAADVAGYSRLMGADEEGTLARLKAARKALVDPSIASHRGRIVKTTGDGVLVEFASAVDAVRCSVEIQRAMAARNADVPPDARIEFRIGVHVGDIIIDDNDIFGDGVNLAARLEGIAEPGGICLSDDAQRQIRGKVDITFDDMGPQALKNISEPMRAWRVQLIGQGAATAQPDSLKGQAPAVALRDKPSIAVLPFQNMSGDPEQEYFADGMTEDIITLLSRTRDFFVIAKSSTFDYKSNSLRISDIAAQLGVRYVLEGSVRKAASRIRVTAQLVEARTENRLWADRFDRELTDLFAVQDDVTSGIVGALHPELLAAEAGSSRRLSPSDLDAWGLVARGMMALTTFTQENVTAASELAAQAIAMAPDFALSYGVQAFALGYRAYMQWGDDWKQDARQASLDIKSVLAQQSDDPTALFLAGGASWFMGRVTSGVGLLERAIQLNPNLAMGRALLSLGYASLDRPNDGLAQVDIAFRLSPRDPMACQFFAAQTLCNFVSGDFPRAISSAEKGLHINPNSLDNHLYMAASLAEMGDVTRAAKQVELSLRIAPKITLEIIARGARDASGWQKYHHALRKAGLPE